MEIMKAIALADGFCPNPFSLEEKLGWCDEVSAGLRRSPKQIYDTIECTVRGPEELQLPDDIAFEDVEHLYLGGRPLEKSDFRTFGCLSPEALAQRGFSFHRPLQLKVVYLSMPAPIRHIELTGTFDLSENYIKMDAPPFIEGDEVLYVPLEDLEDTPDWTAAQRFYVMEAHIDGLTTAEDAFTPQTAAKLALRRVIDDETEVGAPYDVMYVEYLLAKMAHYQHDYEGYAAHTAQYNSLLETYRRECGLRRPLNKMPHWRNYW